MGLFLAVFATFFPFATVSVGGLFGTTFGWGGAQFGVLALVAGAVALAWPILTGSPMIVGRLIGLSVVVVLLVVLTVSGSPMFLTATAKPKVLSTSRLDLDCCYTEPRPLASLRGLSGSGSTTHGHRNKPIKSAPESHATRSTTDLLCPHLEVVAPDVGVCADHVEHCLDRLSLAAGVAAIVLLVSTRSDPD